MASDGVIAGFTLPAHLQAAEPPEARGLRRDEVRLLVSGLPQGSVEHARFIDLPRWLAEGDVLVVNRSDTLKAALSAVTPEGDGFELHVSTQLPGGFWTVELRQPDGVASMPCARAHAGLELSLPGDGRARLLAAYPLRDHDATSSRLWLAALLLPMAAHAFLDRYGFPIRYGYVPRTWPIEMYRTVFAAEPGSAEMPSAARPFTPDLVTRLISGGIDIAPIVLHTGVASLESHEPPYEEFFRVPAATADRINRARRMGGRVIAVGTTVVRALETVTDERGNVSPGEGWTSLVISRERPIHSVEGLITGLHEPRATHLSVLEAVAAAAGRAAGCRRGRLDAGSHVRAAYAAALEGGYLWHEFGDSHLIVGDRPFRAAI
jgi:S-adenosylmethionine:tRNA ribosyltransferase-isomerase